MTKRVGTGRRPTLADVAREAGVSLSTASRALNGQGGPSPETRAVVATAASALQFRPSSLARSLRMRKTSTVGFVVPDISSSFYAAVLLSAQRTLEENGYRVMLMNSERDVDEETEADDVDSHSLLRLGRAARRNVPQLGDLDRRAGEALADLARRRKGRPAGAGLYVDDSCVVGGRLLSARE